jgi:hypothetical protein
MQPTAMLSELRGAACLCPGAQRFRPTAGSGRVDGAWYGGVDRSGRGISSASAISTFAFQRQAEHTAACTE